MSGEPPSVHLLKGKDDVARTEAVVALVERLVGDADRNLVLEELDARSFRPDDDASPDITRLVNAAQTPPFLTDRRVVVARHVGLFGTKDAVAPLVEYLAEPLDTTALVLVWELAPGQAKLPSVPKSLADAVTAAGGVVVDTSPPDRAADRKSWLAEQVAASGLTLDADASRLVAERLGEDASRVIAVLRALEGTYGRGVRLGAADVEPYLGEQGSVAPWDLTDAIDRGDIAASLDALHRMLGAGDRHPIPVLFSLHGHYERMLALDGADVTSEKEAAELLGMKSTYPAKKALTQARRLGSAGVRDAIELLATADLELRGTTGLPEELVLEVLVARLARGAASRR